MSTLGKYKSVIIDCEAEGGVQFIEKIRHMHPGKTIAFASGCYDIFQPGHGIFFEQMHEIADIVVIGIGRDSVLKALKPGRPINSEMNRVYVLASMKAVDYVIIDSSLVEQPGKIDFRLTLETLLPDYFVLNSDDSGIDTKRMLCEKLKIELRLVERIVPTFLDPTSTTEIINKIKNS
jgi:D-beta-D-heptose 7-phosphate kinase/D-beta-D-heptose 1-phosphate adenosyltransferase